MTSLTVHQVESIKVQRDCAIDGGVEWYNIVITQKDGTEVEVTVFPVGEKLESIAWTEEDIS